MKRNHHHQFSQNQPDSSAGKAKMWVEDTAAQPDAGVDELLAVLGYNVRSSDMAEVAQKLEQLEEVMVHAQEDGLSHLVSETVHYNPSDLSTWLETMITELNPPSVASSQPQPFIDDSTFLSESSTITTVDFPGCNSQFSQPSHQIGSGMFDSSDYDLKAIPGKALYGASQNKKLKPSPSPLPFPSSPSLSTSTTAAKTGSSGSSSARPIVYVDSQESGIRLVHTLMACAEAVQQENLKLADALVKQISFLAGSQAGAMRKVATYFAEALARRIFRVNPHNPLDTTFPDLLEMHFYESCPYLKFAHFTANQAILEAFADKKRVHVIDFSMKQGMQWPALMQALALRPGGPPSFRLTGVGPPQPDDSDQLQEVGWKLAQLAETIHVEFEYRGFVANSLADLEPSMLNLRDDEAIAVNSVFELHRLLARPGAIQKVLGSVKEMKPEIFTIVEQEANHNSPVFLDRFNESLHYYSTLFDSLEGCGLTPVNSQDKAMSEVYLGRQICNVVACEGADRVERHETLVQWRKRLCSAGFKAVHLGSNAYKQASVLLALFAGGDGYRVEENDGCLMLGWHTRPLIATSAWQLSDKSSSTTTTTTTIVVKNNRI